MSKTVGLILVCSVAALLSAPSAFAGTATFAGSVNDTDAQLAGTWVDYEPYYITNPWLGTNPGAEADGVTTNLTTLCGSRTLADLGAMTMAITQPNWDWADYWWGAWLEIHFTVVGEEKITVGIGSPYNWGDYYWVYIQFGTDDSTRIGWDEVYFGGVGNEPLGVRLVSDGTNISLEASLDRVTYTALTDGSWPINALPEIGDLSSQVLDCEIAVYGPCAPVRSFSWTAATVPDLNGTNVLDADEDGLNDNVETDTGVYVDANNTGTDPYIADTDGDGVSDGDEVSQGSSPLDPNDPVNTVPVAGLLGLGCLAAACLAGGARLLRKK